MFKIGELKNLKESDFETYSAIIDELNRLNNSIELIASENVVSPAVLEATGSVMTNKYAEGYSQKRYYGGCKFVDVVENLAKERLKKLFLCDDFGYEVNVQPHSGSQANMAVYFAMLNVGDTILAMDLNSGGHMTHGLDVNFSGRLFNFVSYGTDSEGFMDYDNIRQLAIINRPKMIVAGASAYPRKINFEKLADIAKEIGAYLMVDIAHIAGLVAVGLHPSPLGYADFITSTTHKTLRGTRGGIILCKKEFEKQINSSIFPGIQGGPLMHVIAGKAAAFKEALKPDFREYQNQILKNAKAMEEVFKMNEVSLVSGGTDNHLMLIDLRKFGLTGKKASYLLEEVGITVNKNCIPNDPEKPWITSGIRIGTPAITTRGFKEKESRDIAQIICDVLSSPEDEEVKQKAIERVKELCEGFLIYEIEKKNDEYEVNEENLFNNLINISGEVIPFFSGIGKFRGDKEYNEDEEVVLKYFFTNIQSNVYCATDNMPNELWALIMGQYARSNLTARDRLLKLFKDMEEKGEGISVKNLAELIRSHGNVSEELSKHLKKAGNFIEKWGVKYGHASLRDSGVIRICFEGVSQRVTNILESAREGAYQEQSTRALPFTMENIGIPYEIQGTEYENIMKKLDEKIISFYDKVYKTSLDFLRAKFLYLRERANLEIQEKTGIDDSQLSEREWDSIIAGKAFDIARYLLPQNMTTSLGITLNTRRFQDQLSEWQSLPFMEMRVLGKVAQVESMKISPSLMKYGNSSDYQKGISASLCSLRKSLKINIPNNFVYKHYDYCSKLISFTPELEDYILASILLNSSEGNYSLEELKNYVKNLSLEERREIAECVTIDKKGYENFSKKMEIGSLVFERLYDIGAFRDLQRQRGDRQQYSKFAVVGYNMPEEIREMGFESEFIQIMNDVKEFYDLLIEKGYDSVAEYVPLMANVIRHITTKDPVQCFYEAKLRTQPSGIDSYRKIAQDEIKQTLKLLPSFEGLVPYDNKYYELGRLPETIRMAVDRINKKKLKN